MSVIFCCCTWSMSVRLNAADMAAKLDVWFLVCLHFTDVFVISRLKAVSDLRRGPSAQWRRQDNVKQEDKKVRGITWNPLCFSISPFLCLSTDSKDIKRRWVECRQTTKAGMIKMWVEVVSGWEIVWLMFGCCPSQPPLLEINRRRCWQLKNGSFVCIRHVEGGTDFTSLRCTKVPLQDVLSLSTLGLRLSRRKLGHIQLEDCLPTFSPLLMSSPLLS